MKEIWKTVIEFEKYEVSNFGKIRNKETGKVKKVSKRKRDGYYEVSLQKDSKQYTKCIHILVAKTFIENPNKYPAINHIDGNKENNAVRNLEWCTYKYNNIHKYYVIKKCVRSVRCKDTNVTYPSIAEASRKTGISGGLISLCCSGKRNYASGYVWEYV